MGDGQQDADSAPHEVEAHGSAEELAISSLSNFLRTAISAVGVFILIELKRGLERPEIAKNLDRGIIKYIAAAGALAYSGKEVYTDDIAKLLTVIDTVPEDDMLELVGNIHYKNKIIYLNAGFFILLSGKDKLNVQTLIGGVRVFGMHPDATIASEMIKFIEDYMALKYSSMDFSSGLTPGAKEIFGKISSEVIELDDALADLSTTELIRVMQSRNIKKQTGNIMPYLGAMACLSFSTQPADAEHISKLLEVIGIDVDENLLDAVASAHFKNRIIYANALFFLIAAGIDPSIDYLINVVRALGEPPDAIIATFIIGYYGIKKLEKSSAKWFKLAKSEKPTTQ